MAVTAFWTGKAYLLAELLDPILPYNLSLFGAGDKESREGGGVFESVTWRSSWGYHVGMERCMSGERKDTRCWEGRGGGREEREGRGRTLGEMGNTSPLQKLGVDQPSETGSAVPLVHVFPTIISSPRAAAA